MTRNNKAIFGDFQTPVALARQIALLAKQTEPSVSAVVEPTCGLGSFLVASAEVLGPAVPYYGFDINPLYVEEARRATAQIDGAAVRIECQDFYAKDWPAFFGDLPPGILVIGNPPWVTSAALGAMGGGNLPAKTNFQGHGGLAAKTGKANFDISEWMLIRLLEALQNTRATLAMLCKTATARKVLRHAWKNGLGIHSSSIHRIDAGSHFGVSVDACLLLTHTGRHVPEQQATAYEDLTFQRSRQKFGILNGELVSDIEAYQELCMLDGLEYRRWRSGVKHDAARVMELTKSSGAWRNGAKEQVEIEDTWLYPLLKSSDLANARLRPTRFVLLTQQRVGDDTARVRLSAPLTWQYLLDHAEYLDRRRSAIYTGRARFSIFGIGAYTFAPWKVAISGLYKDLVFRAIGQHQGKPIVLDNTCYFLPCETQDEATFFTSLLNSDLALRFIRSLVFVDSKRPVTIDVLKRIDLNKLAEKLGAQKRASGYLVRAPYEHGSQQLLLFENGEEYRAGGGSG